MSFGARGMVLAVLSAIATGVALPAYSQSPVRIALTFDDLPAHGRLLPGETRLSVATAILAALKQRHVREAYGFVAGSFGDGDPDAARVLAAWRAAGHPLGNHSWSHANLDHMEAGAYKADIVRNEALIAPLMKGRNWHWFRYPYLAEGSDPIRHVAVRTALAARGYRVASVTLNFDDWAYNEPYVRCLAKGDVGAVAQLEVRWLTAASDSLVRARAATKPGTPLVALLHVGTFTARMLPALLTQWHGSGARFVGLAQAQRHSLYAGDTIAVATGNPVHVGASPPPPTLDDFCR